MKNKLQNLQGGQNKVWEKTQKREIFILKILQVCTKIYPLIVNHNKEVKHFINKESVKIL